MKSWGQKYPFGHSIAYENALSMLRRMNVKHWFGDEADPAAANQMAEANSTKLRDQQLVRRHAEILLRQ